MLWGCDGKNRSKEKLKEEERDGGFYMVTNVKQTWLWICSKELGPSEDLSCTWDLPHGQNCRFINIFITLTMLLFCRMTVCPEDGRPVTSRKALPLEKRTESNMCNINTTPRKLSECSENIHWSKHEDETRITISIMCCNLYKHAFSTFVNIHFRNCKLYHFKMDNNNIFIYYITLLPPDQHVWRFLVWFSVS